jgi:hypothetical protein
VASSSVVELEPGGKSVAALGVGEEDLPVMTRSMRVSPKLAKEAAALSRNAAQVGPFSSGSISE